MLAVNSDQVQVELSSPLGLSIFQDDLEMGCLLVSLEGDLVVVISKFHDL
jgi:hypothetical protein